MLQRLVVHLGEALQRIRPWHELPRPLGLFCLIGIRIRLRFHNLYDPAPQRGDDAPPTGEAGFPFGRNQPLWGAPHEPAGAPGALVDPSPRVVSETLLARNGSFAPVPFLNLLAGAWLQFQVHDWIMHDKDPDPARRLRVPLAEGDAWPERADGDMLVARTRPSAMRRRPGGPPVYDNSDTHWWDASQVYGTTAEARTALREHRGGRLHLGEDGALPVDPTTGLERTGVSNNWWTGLSLLHWLFANEHNAICERLEAAHPEMGDDELYERARKVNAAVMAKIHTVEWTPAVLPHPTVRSAMRGNWYGMFGERGSRLLRRFTRSDLLIGIPGSRCDDHGVPYSLTEEFVAVYRMHPLIPDEVRLVDADGRDLGARTMPELTGDEARVIAREYRAADLVASLAVGRAGQIRLRNYPDFLRNLARSPEDVALGDEPRIDLATIDVLRDRERAIPRYNEFRRMLRLPPRATYHELTGGDEDAVRRLTEVYGPDGVERVDLMVGLYAEPLPAGFGFSETAFRIFVLMASRRLKSDPSFTDRWGPGTYTAEGLRWIAERTMAGVIAQHLPTLRPLVEDVKNPFEPWDRPCNRRSGDTAPFAPAECEP
jgi:hypothetical protein